MRHELIELIELIQDNIEPDFRAYEDDDVPGTLLTIGTDDGSKWGYQTGDNSYTGGAYGYRVWGVAGVYKDSDPADVADDIMAQIDDQLPDTVCGLRILGSDNDKWFI
jgi:hypothetical protein